MLGHRYATDVKHTRTQQTSALLAKDLLNFSASVRMIARAFQHIGHIQYAFHILSPFTVMHARHGGWRPQRDRLHERCAGKDHLLHA